MTSLEFHGLAHGAQRGDREAAQRLLRLGLHGGLVEPVQPVDLLPAEVHVLHHVEVVAEREILIDDLDAQPRGVLRPVDVHQLPVEEDLARVDGMDPGDALDERRLARAVVADQGHDLARRDVEVDLVESLDRAEGLRDPAKLQNRRVTHCCSSS
jgi:hypothetical protein